MLPSLPKISDLLRLYKLSSKAQLSQNFLLNLNVTDKMIKCLVPHNLHNSIVIEVGPGPGSLTRSLLNLGAKKVVAVEKDLRFRPILEGLENAAEGRLKVVYGDMLKLSEKELIQLVSGVRDPVEYSKLQVKLVGNLPFGVATEMLLKWLRQLDQRQEAFEPIGTQMLLCFQREVAQRIASKLGEPTFTRLSVMSQRLCEVQTAIKLEPKNFVPAPEVHSHTLLFTPRAQPLGEEVSIDALEEVLRVFFSQKRKMIGTFLKSQNFPWISPERLQEIGIPLTARPQQIPIEAWTRLATDFQKFKKPINFSEL